jgi:hypothetical protein
MRYTFGEVRGQPAFKRVIGIPPGAAKREPDAEAHAVAIGASRDRA